MRALIINQSVPQLWTTWGRDERITPTCDVKVFFTASDRTTAEAAVDLLTKVTQQRTTASRTAAPWHPLLSRRTLSESPQERPLMTPEEMLLFPLDKMAIFPMGQPRILGDKLDMQRESWLLRRFLPPPQTVIPYEAPPVLPEAPVPPAPGAVDPVPPPQPVTRPAASAPKPAVPPKPAARSAAPPPPPPPLEDEESEVDMSWLI
jgi:type IV secretory pathway TraG/TraD family ATPase VirD4